MDPKRPRSSRARRSRLADPHEIPSGVLAAGDVFGRFATDDEDLEHLDRSGMSTCRPSERPDLLHHAVVYDERSRAPLAVATLTTHTARRNLGLRVEESFHLGHARDAFAGGVEVRSVEFAPGARCGRVEALLARCLARYLVWNERTLMFGAYRVQTPDAAAAAGLAASLDDRDAFDRCALPASARHPALREPGAGRHVALPHALVNLLALGAVAHPTLHHDVDARATDVLLELDLREVDAHVRRTLVERGGAYAWREWTVFAA